MPLKSDQELKKMEELFDELWPICRSLTGQGVRDTLDIIDRFVPLIRHEAPSGSKVFDWEVPKEWNIRDAYILTPDGKKVANFQENNLHVLNYSIPINRTVSKAELSEHVYTLKTMPDAIPYVTSYYREKWGFCLSENVWNSLPEEGDYQVVIDSTLEPGKLDYAEAILPGNSKKEIMFSTYVCHPSMANNELSGPLAAIFLYDRLSRWENREFTYRFVFAPETIGVIAFLAKSGDHLKKELEAGYVMTCCGDRGNMTYKRSKHEHASCDQIATHVLRHSGYEHKVIPFAVGGSDERQYCSPGFNLPVGSLMRTPYQKYKEYHTSLDNKEFISFKHLQELVDTYEQICAAHELNGFYFNEVQFCEPQLGKRGLYPDSTSPEDPREEIHRMLDFLSYADGNTSLVEIADRIGHPIWKYQGLIEKCMQAGLVRKG